ncbi:MAG: hypothetical protein WAS73_00725 [Defluviicoccus sp.]
MVVADHKRLNHQIDLGLAHVCKIESAPLVDVEDAGLLGDRDCRQIGDAPGAVQSP